MEFRKALIIKDLRDKDENNGIYGTDSYVHGI